MSFTISDDASVQAPPATGISDAPFKYTIDDEGKSAAPAKKADDDGIPFLHEFAQGVGDVGDLLGGSMRFLSGNPQVKEPTPMQDALRDKHQAGTADRHDYEAAFLEGMGQSPGGKLLGAIGGITPEANVVSTAMQRWINPTVSKATGVDPNEINIAEMAAGPIVAAKLRTAQNEGTFKPSDLPSARAAGKVVDTVTSPIQTGAKAIQLGLAPVKAVTSPIVKGILNADNPFTGGPGLDTAMDSSIAKEGSRLESNIPGLVLSAGEKTGNPGAMSIEDALANSAKWGGRFAEKNQKNVDAIVGKFNDTLDSIYGQETVPENMGQKLTTAYNGTFDSLNKIRRQQAKVDFGAAYDNSDDQGQYIQSNNLFRTLQELRDEGNARLLTSAKAIGGKEGRTLLSKMATITKGGNEMASPMTIKELGNGLSDYGEAAADPELGEATKRVYARIYDSLQKDLNEEINKSAPPQGYTRLYRGTGGNLMNSKVGGDWWSSDLGKAQKYGDSIKYLDVSSDQLKYLGRNADGKLDEFIVDDPRLKNTAKDLSNPQRTAMLAVARDNYKGFSDKISDLQKTTLGNLVGYAAHDSQGRLTIAPETVANKFNTMPTSELRSTLKFLDDNHPDVANMGRRYMLESVLRKAQEGVGMRGVGTTKPFAKADFVKNLPPPDKLNALIGDGRAYDDVTDVAAATNRMIDWGADKSGSQTFQRNNIFSSLYGLGKGALFKSVVSDNLAEDLLDPSKRHQMGVQARQWQKVFDDMKAKSSDFMKDQTGALNIGKAKERLQQMQGPLKVTIRPSDKLPDINLPTTEGQNND